MTCEIRIYPVPGATTLFHLYINGSHKVSFENLIQVQNFLNYQQFNLHSFVNQEEQ